MITVLTGRGRDEDSYGRRRDPWEDGYARTSCFFFLFAIVLSTSDMSCD